MKATLLQHAIGDDVALLDISQAYHQRYCDSHNITYRCTRDRIREDSRHPVWEKVAAIRRELRAAADGELLAWLDADAIVADIAVDLRTVVPLIREQNEGHGGVGMVRWQGGLLNAGVIYAVVDHRSRAYFDRVDVIGYVPNPWGLKDQATFDKVAKMDAYQGLVVEVPSQWNSYRYAKHLPTGNAVVKAWHGDKLEVAAAGLAEVVAGAGV